MPTLNKRVLSQFLRSKCLRRLRLDLHSLGSQATRDIEPGMPERDPARPGLAHLTAAGRDYETRKFLELRGAFGAERVYVGGDVVPNKPADPLEPVERSFEKQELGDVIGRLVPGTFAIEAEFVIPQRFRALHGLDELEQRILAPRGQQLRFATVRPDIIEAVAPAASRRIVDERGQVAEIGGDDPRVGLRIIDVKLTAEPSPSYFGELAFYAMTLASWLVEHGRETDFVVLADAAIWPGKHAASAMEKLERDLLANENRQPTLAETYDAFRLDLATIEAEVFMSRVQRFFTDDLVRALEPADWRQLSWHIDTRCAGCDYLGYRWREAREPDPNSCWQEAERTQHLSQIHGLTFGARGMLERAEITRVEELAALQPGDDRLDLHQTLRAGRAVFTARAAALGGVAANIPDRAGTSVSLPRFSTVRIAIMAEFDVGSGITFAFGWRGTRIRQQGEDQQQSREDVFVVRRKTVDEEGVQLRALLGRIVRYLEESRLRDPAATVQVYVWDRVTFEHFQRVVSRHLPHLLGAPAQGEPYLRELVWLFPPEDVIHDPTYVGKTSPITIVGDVVRSLAALGVPHYYQVLAVARTYYAPWSERNGQAPQYNVYSLFMDPLSDHIPSERAHEIWRQVAGPVPYQTVEEQLRRTMQTKMSAMLSVAGRLAVDLGARLIAKAPPVARLLDIPAFTTGISSDAEIWYQHQRLLSAAAAYDVEIIRAMAPHEREARFHSVRLTGEIDGHRRHEIFDLHGINDDDRTHVFGIREQSRAAKIKVGEFDWALFDENQLDDLQPRKLGGIQNVHPQIPVNGDGWKTIVNMCAVKVVALDPARQYIVVKTSNWEPRDIVREFLDQGIFNFAPRGANAPVAILDPIHRDYFLRRFLDVLKAIGKPPLSVQAPLSDPDVVRVRRRRRVAQTAPTPIDRFIWDAVALANERTGLPVDAVRNAALNVMPDLTRRQVEAVDQAADRRLSLIWGPPGTGKSKTSVAFAVALLSLAAAADRRQRILITGPTWVAIDNVLGKIPALLHRLGLAQRVRVVRLLSGDLSGVPETLRPYARVHDDGVVVQQVIDPRAIVVLGGTPQQVANVVRSAAGTSQAELFERVIIDEASQMDVAHAIMALCGLTFDAAVTVVGDDLQMPPIQPIDPPETLETMVGSIYEFYRWYRGRKNDGADRIHPTMLDTNFRSNRSIVEFVRQAGYEQGLHPAHPDFALRFTDPIPTQRPEDWSQQIPWSEEYQRILDPRESLVAVVSADTIESQMNVPEAQVIAGIVRSVWGRLSNRLETEQIDVAERAFGPEEFFRHGLGIVTPHRAQQAAVVNVLSGILPNAPLGEIYDAVDTVERFQGQEKNIMIASFGLGDADQIAIEEEFLYNLNRFNVIASRARAKFVLFVARSLVDHLPHEVRVIRESRLLKHFVDGFLQKERTVELPPLPGPVRIRTR